MRVRTPRDLGIAVRHARHAAGLTQEDLATLAKVSRPWISALEKGKAGAELASILKVVGALDLAFTLEADDVATRPSDPADLDTWLDRYQGR